LISFNSTQPVLAHVERCRVNVFRKAINGSFHRCGLYCPREQDDGDSRTVSVVILVRSGKLHTVLPAAGSILVFDTYSTMTEERGLNSASSGSRSCQRTVWKPPANAQSWIRYMRNATMHEYTEPTAGGIISRAVYDARITRH
jgi:hypothetical protein